MYFCALYSKQASYSVTAAHEIGCVDVRTFVGPQPDLVCSHSNKETKTWNRHLAKAQDKLQDVIQMGCMPADAAAFMLSQEGEHILSSNLVCCILHTLWCV